jgi:hypothetical protein
MSEQMRILKMIEDGEVSPEEGAKLLQELGSQPTQPEAENTVMGLLEQIEKGELSPDEGIDQLNQGAVIPTAVEPQFEEEEQQTPPPQISEEELNRWKNWWQIPMYVGIGVVILSAFWLNSAYQNSGYGFWFFCSWVPMALGVLLISLSWMSQKGPWIHVRVRGKENVAISMPAPLGLVGWGLRNFGHYVPNLDETAIDEIINALDQTTKSDTPMYINVEDEEDGEHVEVFIG